MFAEIFHQMGLFMNKADMPILKPLLFLDFFNNQNWYCGKIALLLSAITDTLCK